MAHVVQHTQDTQHNIKLFFTHNIIYSIVLSGAATVAKLPITQLLHATHYNEQVTPASQR